MYSKRVPRGEKFIGDALSHVSVESKRGEGRVGGREILDFDDFVYINKSIRVTRKLDRYRLCRVCDLMVDGALESFQQL